MSERTVVFGQFYETVLVGGTDVVLQLRCASLPALEVRDGILTGAEVRVATRGVLVVADGDGLAGRPLEPISLREGALCFGPVGGGVRTRDNRLAGGSYNEAVAEATRFGMVNAYLHATRVARYVNRLLGQLGAPALPVLPVIVSAHSGSRLAGFGHGDGDYRSGRMRPLSGGHYRVSQRTTGVPEPDLIWPSGEMHLGPGRLRQPFAGRDSYLRAAAHNPATIYHEYGHHLCRHTADFRLNAERPPAEQRNGKPGLEEGVCDYLAASMLRTGRPYGWYRRERGERRDPAGWSGRNDDGLVDGYALGARWAALWWRCRQRLQLHGHLDAEGHDRALMATLLALGATAEPGTGSRRARQLRRCSPETVLDAYLGAVRNEGGPAAVDAVCDLTDGAFGRDLLTDSQELSC
jgi:hypothetical protein